MVRCDSQSPAVWGEASMATQASPLPTGPSTVCPHNPSLSLHASLFCPDLVDWRGLSRVRWGWEHQDRFGHILISPIKLAAPLERTVPGPPVLTAGPASQGNRENPLSLLGEEQERSWATGAMRAKLREKKPSRISSQLTGFFKGLYVRKLYPALSLGPGGLSCEQCSHGQD